MKASGGSTIRRLASWLGDFGDVEGAWFEKLTVLLAFALCTSAGALVVYRHDVERTTFMLWAGASLAAGFLVGFLFGIPRTLQSEQLPGGEGSDGYRQRVNTNLESISDWLTKIIVGLGLIQLRDLPSKLDAAARYISCGPGNTCGQKVFAGAEILYFAIVGFIGGYLLTRLYLAPAFRRAEDPGQKLARVMAGRSPSPETPGRSREAVETISVVLSAFRDLEQKAPVETVRKDIERLESLTGSMPLSRELFIVLGRLYKTLGDYEKALDVLTHFIENKRRAGAPPDTDLETALYNRACYYTLLMKERDSGEASQYRAKALQDLKEAFQITPSDRASARNDPDFAALSEDDEFKALTQDAEPGGR